MVPNESAGAVQPEGQLAVVIGKKAKNVPVDEALDYVFGYTIGNDISERPWQQADRNHVPWKKLRHLEADGTVDRY